MKCEDCPLCSSPVIVGDYWGLMRRKCSKCYWLGEAVE